MKYDWLVIDDLRYFPADRKPAGDITYVKTAGDAMRLFKTKETVDVAHLLLDHDLGYGTIRPFVLELIGRKVNPDEYGQPWNIEEAMVISYNPVGRRWIYDQLKDYYTTKLVMANSVLGMIQ